MSYRRRRRPGWFWILLGVATLLAGTVRACEVVAQAAVVPLTVTCAAGSGAAVITVTNGSGSESGWFHGYSVTVQPGARSRTVVTNPDRLAPGESGGWIVGFQPHAVTSCTASVLPGR
jgi:type IV secretory pathway protease TraF